MRRQSWPVPLRAGIVPSPPSLIGPIRPPHSPPGHGQAGPSNAARHRGMDRPHNRQQLQKDHLLRRRNR
ncbi:hypothetical protein XH88_08675 [Bradyrhizobium sp. CCBAU 51627]|nr:hypothetical protein [Bradyrhizobium sp. CCBAU 51627]